MFRPSAFSFCPSVSRLASCVQKFSIRVTHLLIQRSWISINISKSPPNNAPFSLVVKCSNLEILQQHQCEPDCRRRMKSAKVLVRIRYLYRQDSAAYHASLWKATDDSSSPKSIPAKCRPAGWHCLAKHIDPTHQTVLTQQTLIHRMSYRYQTSSTAGSSSSYITVA